METTTDKTIDRVKTITITCPHCQKDIETDQLEELQCCSCNNDFLSIQTKECPICENVFCLSCAEDELNEHGFCNDCAEIECTYCEDSFDRGEHHECVKCKNPYCDDCAKLFIDDDGLCVKCTSQEKVTCSDCDATIIKSRSNVCKNYVECKNAYCNDENCAHLEDSGYCQDCGTFECSMCENSFSIESKVKCPNQACTGNKKYCPDCFNKTKDMAGNCVDCSPEPKANCKRCNRLNYARSLAECSNCRRKLCPICEDLMPCIHCDKKVCGQCGDRCSQCQKPFCFGCMKFKRGRCNEHKGFWAKLLSLN